MYIISNLLEVFTAALYMLIILLVCLKYMSTPPVVYIGH